MRDLLGRIHRRLLPDNPWIGWTPYLWLVYLGFFYIKFFFVIPPWTEWVATALATVVFLYLYFSGYWRQGRPLVFNIGGIAAIGIVMAPVNIGAGVFFIYAGAFVPFVGGYRTTLSLVSTLVAIALLEAWAFGLSASFWLPAAIITPLVAFANYHFVSMARKELALRRSQAEVERLAQVAERERIARDLHDLLGHTLSVIALKAELARKLVDRKPADARAEIEDVEGISRQALAQVREAVTGYRRASLQTEIEQAQTALKAGGIELEVQLNGVQPPAAQESTLALALREATTNVIRHARATRCRFTLASAGDHIVLTIEDNGTGGDFEEGSGLAGMRERVRAAGGGLSISCDGGTMLRVALPLEAQVPEPCPGC